MGFFSWKTSDTKERIMNTASGLNKTVYMLQPGGIPPIREDEYEGYGVFGGVDVFVWLAQHNIPQSWLNSMPEGEIRSLGILLDTGVLLQHRDGTLINVFHAMPKPVLDFIREKHRVIVFPGTYDKPIPEYGKSANDLRAKGDANVISYADLIEVKYPIKFSFNKKADYKLLPAAEIDDGQGFFDDE